VGPAPARVAFCDVGSAGEHGDEMVPTGGKITLIILKALLDTVELSGQSGALVSVKSTQREIWPARSPSKNAPAALPRAIERAAVVMILILANVMILRSE
jgi:hypothetical protein